MSLSHLLRGEHLIKRASYGRSREEGSSVLVSTCVPSAALGKRGTCLHNFVADSDEVKERIDKLVRHLACQQMHVVKLMLVGLFNEVLQSMREIFEAADTDKSGRLDKDLVSRTAH